MKLKFFLRAAFLSAVLTVMCVVTAGATSVGVGTVNSTSGLRLREQADTGSSILATASKGDVVVVLERAEDGWYKVNYKAVEGYMLGEYLDVENDCEKDLGYGEVSAEGSALNIRSGAGVSYDRVGSVKDGSLVKLEGMTFGWYKVSCDGKEGYVSSDYVKITDKRPAPPASNKKSQTSAAKSGTPVVPSDVGASSLGQGIANMAYQFLGCRYVYGAEGPNAFDCSGLTYYIARQFGYSIPRGASAQWTGAAGKRIYSMSELQPGDFFYINNPSYGRGKAVSHVAIYVGGGKVIHASTPSTGVIMTDINVSWMGPYFVGALRLG